MCDRIINILFLGGAKRVSMGRKLIKAGAELGCKVVLYSYELEPHVPIAAVAEVIIGKRWKDPSLMEHLHGIVVDKNIDIILPFVDPAVAVAGAYVERFGDAWSPVVGPALAEMLFDKVSCAVAFEEAGLSIPETYHAGRPVFPMIAKPRHGSASKGLQIINDVSEFRRIMKVKDEYVIQRYYPDREEYTVDCYVGADGRPLCIIPRKRLEVLGGEVSRTVTVYDLSIVDDAYAAIARLGLRGPVTIQYLRDRESGRLMLMEINPRLGGGVVCSVHAGADIPMLILREYMGLELRPVDEILPGTMICRYFEETVFYGCETE